MPLPPFQALLDDHGRDVHRFLIATVGRDDADDCYQETWLSALRAYPRLRNAANLRGWIFTVAHRKALDRIRARRRAPVAVGSPEVVLAGAIGERGALAGSVERGALAGPREPGALPDEELWAAVRRLPPKQRAALALRFVLDAAYAEIGAAMGTSEEAARRSVHEGLKRLRREYGP